MKKKVRTKSKIYDVGGGRSGRIRQVHINGITYYVVVDLWANYFSQKDSFKYWASVKKTFPDMNYAFIKVRVQDKSGKIRITDAVYKTDLFNIGYDVLRDYALSNIKRSLTTLIISA